MTLIGRQQSLILLKKVKDFPFTTHTSRISLYIARGELVVQCNGCAFSNYADIRLVLNPHTPSDPQINK